MCFKFCFFCDVCFIWLVWTHCGRLSIVLIGGCLVLCSRTSPDECSKASPTMIIKLAVCLCSVGDNIERYHLMLFVTENSERIVDVSSMVSDLSDDTRVMNSQLMIDTCEVCALAVGSYSCMRDVMTSSVRKGN